MKYKIIRKKLKIRVSDILFIAALMFLLPNDYINLFFGLEYLVIGLSLSCVFYCVFKYYPSLLTYLKYYYIFFVPDIIECIYSIIYGTFGLSNIYAIFQKVLVYCLCICFLKGLYDKNRIVKMEKLIFLILFFTAISVYYFKGPISYTASGGRVYFIFEGDIAKLLLVAFLLILENESLTKMAIIIQFPR